MAKPPNCIMLIEDCEADKYLHTRVINDLVGPEHVVVVKSGDDALDFIGSSKEGSNPHPDLIFLDINTPGMEGWDFVEEFEKFEEDVKNETVIVMLTGSLDPDDRARAAREPLIREYCTKPLNRSTMREILAKHFPA